MTERRFTILVVDDDANARLVMRAALRKAGYDVVLAESGEDALARYRQAPTDLVMLDVEMPGLDGHQVCAALRAEAGPLLPIVMVTGMDDLPSVELAYEHGATDFISKPVNWALIGHRVRYLFRGYQALRDLQAAEARNAAILNAIPDLLFEIDIDGLIIDYRSPKVHALALLAESPIGLSVTDILPPQAAQTCLQALRLALEHGTAGGVQFEVPMASSSGWFELSVSRKTVAPGNKARFIVLSRDVTERKQAEARITKLAYFDSLTGLPNRQSFLHRVDCEIQRAGRDGAKLAVLFMDLDGFKNINDTMGHAAGDLILQWSAQRLSNGLRPGDLVSRPMGLGNDEAPDFELARLGGDEFTALLLDIEAPEDAMAIAGRIGELMRQPFVLEGREVALSTSIGIAIYPMDGADAATLLKHADTAMYRAKTSGRDNAQLYCASLTSDIVQRMALDTSLRAALERNEFHLVYQPQVNLASGRIDTVEALIRWNHPGRGLVLPLEFITRAEENGLIERIGEWVLATACADAARWNAAGMPVSVSVNVSPLQIGAPGLAGRVLDILSNAGLPAAKLEIEITEGALTENTGITRTALQTLHEHGIRIALDDFGTGYSSLSYLTRMPIGKLKIDRCFVDGLLGGGDSEAIVRAVLAMARSLGLHVTAEGVETIDQARALRAMACEGLQGYYFSRPVAADRIPALLQRRWSLDPVAAPAPPARIDAAVAASLV
jgi:diguanylate cyclase (GGDEF)-like protein/PAS domain S-box-containing protein